MVRMIPELQDDGYLPPGVHSADLHEVCNRFGYQSEIRTIQAESVRWLVDIARRAGVLRLVINGSFVTDVLEPNDVDCVLLIGEDFPNDHDAESELLAGLPFLEFQIVKEKAFTLLVEKIFATDRVQRPKGMIEVRL